MSILRARAIPQPTAAAVPRRCLEFASPRQQIRPFGKNRFLCTTDGGRHRILAPSLASKPQEPALEKQAQNDEMEETEVTGSREERLSEGRKSFWSIYFAQTQELSKKLRRYGLAGVLAYGLFNTAYYLGTFLYVWFFVSPSPVGMGYGQAAQRFVKVFALLWAGSQVTKLLRAAGALVLAPAVDTGLSWCTERFKLESREKAFGIIVGGCVCLALIVFVIITGLWA